MSSGKLLYTLQTSSNFDIWTVNADGSGNAPLITDAASDQGGTWSPDGTKIVFVRNDPDAEIFVMDTDPSTADGQRLTDNATGDLAPEWSPDGTRIAYFLDADNVIAVMNADGSDQHVLEPGPNSNGPQWSPDARRVLFNRNLSGAPNDSHPFAINADGTGLVNLGTMAPRSQAPTWSPDGTKIAFLTIEGESDIFIMNADGTGAVKILDDTLVRSGPKWQPIPRAPRAQTDAPTDIGTTVGPDQTFTTAALPPLATTTRASATQTSATLFGIVDPGAAPAEHRFDYGTDASYGAATAAKPTPAGPATEVSETVAGLKADTEYHFRVVATGPGGPGAGGDATIRTLRKAKPRSLSTRANPRRDRKPPFRYVFSGRLGLPAGVQAGEACSGKVSIQVRSGRRRITTKRANLTKSCTYRKVVSFKSRRQVRASSGRLKVTTSFPGNGVLTSRRARALSVGFG